MVRVCVTKLAVSYC